MDARYDNPFKDVPAGKWYTTAALWANEMGYITGTSPDTFSPNNKLTRAMFVQILARTYMGDAPETYCQYSGK